MRRATIPKPDGGEREPGIPAVADRLTRQAPPHVPQPILDPTFSEHGYSSDRGGVHHLHRGEETRKRKRDDRMSFLKGVSDIASTIEKCYR